jgi:hypothetical protein
LTSDAELDGTWTACLHYAATLWIFVTRHLATFTLQSPLASSASFGFVL